MNLTNTPYDDVFRTLLNDCKELIIPLINEVFGEHYTGREKIVFAPNEHYLIRQDGDEAERITDTSFEIQGKEVKKYHWECQSSTDNSMLARFFEYDTQIALDQGEVRGNVLTVTFPHSAALYLRCSASTPDRMKIRMATPAGSIEYDIPVMKSQRYTLEELLECGAISEYTKCTVIDMSNKVLEHIAVKYESVRKGVKSVMGGKVLDYEAKTIRNEGWNEGRREGRNEGRMEILIDFVQDGLLSVAEAAAKAGVTEDVFRAKMQVNLGDFRQRSV